ncbi:FAD-binding domain-containing protein [Blastomonas fulva]|uniref:FAD-binding domain-containing protein n=1 Tax=Blastomonas fulva TaxID=1550728 RepID=UPI003F6FFCEF
MSEPPLFPPTRTAGLDRLAAFVPHAGADYAMGRNTDPGPDAPAAVSRLSPYLRYRLLIEQETAGAVLAEHSLHACEKYVQEVLWRTYWKGWLEMRPQVWARFVAERDRQREAFRDTRAIADAEAGRTGIEGFDDLARELVATGYLHNHARMWFASIWIFTLRLPWALGADFFLRHLIDADAASNTLSWRWVAGLQTAGKTYLATADNIARYTNGRFAPKGLAEQAEPLSEAAMEPAQPMPQLAPLNPRTSALLLVTPEDMHPESALPRDADWRGAMIVNDASLLWGDGAREFVRAASADAGMRVTDHFGCSANPAARLDAATLIGAAHGSGAQQVVTAFAPVGPVADALTQAAPVLAAEGIPLVQVRREWDDIFWPHARKGFFPFKQQMPRLLAEIGMPGR